MIEVLTKGAASETVRLPAPRSPSQPRPSQPPAPLHRVNSQGPTSARLLVHKLAPQLLHPSLQRPALPVTQGLLHLRHFTPEGLDVLARVLRRAIERNRGPHHG